MPFCPKCKYEYRSEISECPDCNERLVANMPPEDDETESEAHFGNWTPIATLTSPQYAEMIVEALRSKDIPAVLTDGSGHFGRTGQMGTSSFRPVVGAGSTLHVPLEYAEDAAREVQVILGEGWDKVRLIDLED